MGSQDDDAAEKNADILMLLLRILLMNRIASSPMRSENKTSA